jgi:hypothetical protein
MPNQALIKLSFCYRNHLDDVKEYSVQFMCIPDFTNYLRWEPEKAMLIGYGKVNEETVRNSRTSNVKISIDHHGRTSTFDTAKQFGDFLKKSPEIAGLLQLKLSE